MKKLFLPKILILFSLLLAICGGTKTLSASAKYQSIWTASDGKVKDRTVGKTIFEYKDQHLYATRNGEKTLLASDKNLQGVISTNGISVYYCITDYSKLKADVYCISSIGNKAKKVLSIKYKTEEGFSFEGYYNGKIYYVSGEDGSDKGRNLYSCSIKTKKKKFVAKDAGDQIKQYGQYFYVLPYLGDNFYTGSLRMHNAKTGKTEVVCKQSPGYRILSGSLYYLETKKVLSHTYGYDIAVKKCSLNGKGKKTLLPSLKMKYYEEFSTDRIKYYDLSEKIRTKKY